MLLSNSEIETEGTAKEVNECPQTLRGDGRQDCILTTVTETNVDERT